jgi:hypothetical protein
MVGGMIGVKYTHSMEGVAFVGSVEPTTDMAFKLIDERQNELFFACRYLFY